MEIRRRDGTKFKSTILISPAGQPEVSALWESRGRMKIAPWKTILSGHIAYREHIFIFIIQAILWFFINSCFPKDLGVNYVNHKFCIDHIWFCTQDVPVHFILPVSICFTVVVYLKTIKIFGDVFLELKRNICGLTKLCMIDWHSKNLSNCLLFSRKEVVMVTPLFYLLLKISIFFSRLWI